MKFAKIPNDFFYNDGQKLNKIGGKLSFNLYTLVVHYKNMADICYITLNEINKLLSIDTNNTRAKCKIIYSLDKLRQSGLIYYDYDLEKVKSNEFIEITWIDTYSNTGMNGWIAQYSNDFNYLKKVGEVGYLVMWMIRTHINSKTGTAFLPISSMAQILSISTKTIVDTIFELEKEKYLEVIRNGAYHYNKDYDRMVRLNNNYRWRG